MTTFALGCSIPAHADDAYESNDTLAIAYDLSAHEGNLLSEIDGPAVQRNNDWYKIEVPANRLRVIVDCWFTHGAGNIDLQIYEKRSIFSLVLDSSASDNDNEHLDVRVPVAGVYYIRVSGVDRGNDLNTYDRLCSGVGFGPAEHRR